MTKCILSLFLIFILLLSCEKSPEVAVVPIFETQAIDAPTFSYAFFDAEIDKKQEDQITKSIEDHGFVWSAYSNNSLENPNSQVIRLGKKQRNYAFGGFAKNLIGGTRYYVRAYIKMNNQTYYANEINFVTNPGTWKKLKDFPGEGLVNATAFSLKDKGYIVGSNSNKTQVWMYDPGSDTWTRKTDAPFYTEGPTSFVINDKGYVYCSGLWEYNPTEDSWLSKINSFPAGYWRGCGGVSSFVVNKKAYIGSGKGNLNINFVEWDPETNTSKVYSWKYLNPDRSYAGAFTINGKCYIAGGEMWFYEEKESVIEYDFNNQTSSYKGPFYNDIGLATNRKEMISFSVNGKGYMGMGYGEFPLMYGIQVGSQYDFYQYNPTTNSWIPQTYPVYVDDQNNINFLERAGGVSLVIGNRAFMGLGELREYNNDTQQYKKSPYKDFWEFIPN